MTTEPPALDIDRLLTTLDRHEVDFVLVGGVAAIAYGARRPTADLDCVARRSSDNLERLAAALRSLNARLRVHGLTDEEAALLPTRIDKDTLGRMEISTSRTDAGDFDVLTDLPGRDGRRLRYGDLMGPRQRPRTSTASPSASPPSTTSSPRRSGPIGRRTVRHSSSFESSGG
jgi:hypothetical protein